MNAFKKYGLFLTVTLVILAVASSAFAQPPVVVTPANPGVAVTTFGGPPLKAIGAGLVMIGAAYGFGKIGSSALESMARQPEVAAKVQTAMIIIGALLEGATFFALIVCMQANPILP